MRKLIHPFISIFPLICLCHNLVAQVPATVKPGPAGIFIFTGNDIPSGLSIGSYKLEQSTDNISWKQIADIKTPSTFEAFNKTLEKAKAFFPSQPMPPVDKLSQIYQKAIATGHVDSLKGLRILLPIRMALGIMYYDTSAKKHITYSYRIKAVKPTGETVQSLLTDTLTLPYQARFDSITYSESSYNSGSVVVRWKSTGKNPAPLFMVYTFRYGSPIVARGITSRFTVNDTTYFMYRDTVAAKGAVKEMQFFVSPYDHYGNSGLSSQVAVITQDNFNKAVFVKDKATFAPALSGIQISWHFTDPITVKTFELYRSETDQAGFKKLTEISANDTSFLDQSIWPEKTYYYYVQAVAKAGKRTKQSRIMQANVPGLVMKQKLKAPVLCKVAVVKRNVRLLIEVNDTLSTHLRIYRGMKGGLVSMPGIISINKAKVIEFIDSTLAADNIKDIFYAVRNEIPGTGISSLSDELPVAMIVDPEDVAYFYAFPSRGNIELFWDDVVNRDSKYKSYSLARKPGPPNSKSPVMVLAENITSCGYTDTKVQYGNEYTYILTLFDKTGNIAEKSKIVTVFSSD